MSKKIDWDNIYTPFGSRSLNKSKYGSISEKLQQGLSEQEQFEKSQQMLAKAQPALTALLKSRLASKTPLKVMRQIVYKSCELVHQYEQVEDRENGGWKNGEVKGSSFKDVQKSIRPGTELVLKSLDAQMQEFVFIDQYGKEVVIPYIAQKDLMMHTNIFEDVMKFLTDKGE